MADELDHIARVTKLAEEAEDATTEWRNALERRNQAIKDAVDAGFTPKQLDRAGVPLSEASLYRILGTVA